MPVFLRRCSTIRSPSNSCSKTSVEEPAAEPSCFGAGSFALALARRIAAPRAVCARPTVRGPRLAR